MSKIIACMGSHGSGKGTIAQKIETELGYTFRLSPISGWWKAIDMPDLDKRPVEELEFHQIAITGALGYQLELLTNELPGNYILERSPLDVLAYSKMYSVPAKTMLLQQKYSFQLVQKYIDTILFFPYEAKQVGSSREEHTDYREKKLNALRIDNYMHQILELYLEIENPNTRLIVVTGSIEERIEKIIDGIEGQYSDQQFVYYDDLSPAVYLD
jgi:adenylate kinase family enzyme